MLHSRVFLPSLGLLAALLLGASDVSAQNTQIASFAKAKKLLPQVYAGHQHTFYCGCLYTDKTVDFSSCGYHPKGKADTARRLQWEHVVPAENFGRSFPEWRDGAPACVDNKGKSFKGRSCASKASATFRFMEADLYNLTPESAETNRRRSNYQMGMVPGEERVFGSCDVEIKDRTFEPRPEIRGDIARIYFYMEHAYPGRGIVSRQLRPLLEIWSKEDPVDEWERERARRIERLQGNANPFVR